jgi:hypothetical protein
VDATFKASRNMVANNKTEGKDENSSGLRVPIAIMITTKLIMMLKVNKMSSNNGGNGTTNMAMIKSTSAGKPNPAKSNFERFCRIADRVNVFMVKGVLTLGKKGNGVDFST